MAKSNSGVATIVRQWHMLKTIPRYPRKITVAQIASQMRADGYPVSARTIQRDLNALSVEFPLCADEATRPHGWSWQQSAPAFDIPRLPSRSPITSATIEHLPAASGAPDCASWCRATPGTGPPSRRNRKVATEPCFAPFQLPEGNLLPIA